MAENVYSLYKKNLAGGMSKKAAARDAQERTGVALVTGKPIKGESPSLKTAEGFGTATEGFGIS